MIVIPKIRQRQKMGVRVSRYMDVPSHRAFVRKHNCSGQGCVVPFKGKAQPIVMVKGYTVLAGRAGYTLQGRLIREGDAWRERAGSDPGIDHEPKPGNKGKIVGAYAVARSNSHPTLFSPVLSLDELIATRDRSQGYKSAMRNNNSHPWATDFDAMCIKTPKRLLAKDIPNDMLQAASWLDTQHDLGRAAHLDPRGQGIIDITPQDSPFPHRVESPDGAPVELAPKFLWETPDGSVRDFPNADRWADTVCHNIGMEKVTVDQARAARSRNINHITAVHNAGYEAAARRVSDALDAKIGATAEVG